jgi:hypothetical protein
MGLLGTPNTRWKTTTTLGRRVRSATVYYFVSTECAQDSSASGYDRELSPSWNHGDMSARIGARSLA